MAKRDDVHGFYHKNFDSEVKRIRKEAERQGIFMNWKEATALAAEKSKRGFMTKEEIIKFLQKLKGVIA